MISAILIDQIHHVKITNHSQLRNLIFIVLLTLSVPSLSQEITGTVLDKSTNEVLVGVSVYFDGSSIGTITDENGNFELNPPGNLLAPLIFSHLGYQSRKLNAPFGPNPITVYLTEEILKIPEVVVTSDSFSRRQKLNVFRKEFLGDSRAARNCSILNEDDIRLYYKSFDSTLTASTKAPIIIINSYLRYRIQFDIREFTIAFRSKTLERIDNIKFTRYAGFTRFEDFSNNDLRILKRRQAAYLGSPMHFMRSLWEGNLTDQNYSFNYELKSITPDQLIDRLDDDSDGFKTYEFRKKRFVIYYKNKSYYRSSISLDGTTSFSIDQFGNYSPYQGLIFGGYMADLRISEMLPNDYEIPKSLP